ncbi:unnamed protein product, partial [Heterosigma akashiwo]
DKWILDSGCSTTMVNSMGHLHCARTTNVPITTGNINSKTFATLTGMVSFLSHGGEKGRVNLKNCLYSKTLPYNLFSVSQLTDLGYTVLFGQEEAMIKDKHGNLMAKAVRKPSMLYEVIWDTVNSEEPRPFLKNEGSELGKPSAMVTDANVPSSFNKWHCRMGHMSESRIRDMVKEGLIPETDINLKDKLNFCSTCAKAKITKSDHSSRSPEYTADRPLARVHTDFAGPICRDYKGNKFFVVFKDEHTRFCRVFFMKQKSDILPHFVTYCNAIRRAVDDPQLQVQRVRLDNGREYNEMTNHCDKLGIIMGKTGRDDPRSNGIAERTNR